MASKYETGDLVWAKMKNFSPWPARIVEPQKTMKRPVMKKPMHCVFFFGTQNYAWILEELIWPYEEYKEQYVNKNKSASFKEAVEAIEDYKVKNPKPVKTISPASSEEDIAVLFPSRSSKSGHISGYPQTSFLGRPKIISSPSPSKKGVKRPFQGKETPKQKYKFPKIRPLFKASVGRQNSTVKNTTVDDSSSTSPKSSKVRSPVQVNSSSKPSVSLKLPQPPSPVTPPPMVQMSFDSLKGACFSPSKLKFGFLGLGTLGRRILKNLMDSGHSVMIWNRTASKCVEFVAAGAVQGKSAAGVVSECDITFCCVSTPEAAKEVVFGSYGALQAIGKNKGYVDITSVDPDTALDIAEAITSRGGRYLEAPVSGSKKTTEDGELIILAAGDRSLFNDCSTCFQSIGKHAFFLGEVGNGCKMNLVINMILGTMLAGLSEAMALGDRTGVSLKDIVEVLELGALGAPIIVEKGKAIIEGTFFTEMPLQHMQKDLHLALCMGDKMSQPLPLIAASNEVYKHAKCLRYGEHDISAVYLRARF